jgi:hypothetical protein
MRVGFRINSDPGAVEIEPRLHLADCLRDVLVTRIDPSRS